MKLPVVTRRQFCSASAAMLASLATTRSFRCEAAGVQSGFRLNYIVSAAMYGTFPLADVLPEAHKLGADAIDVWPMPHGNHREQMDELGLDRFAELLKANDVRLGAVTRYDLPPSKLGDEFKMLERFGGKVLVTGASNPDGATVRDQVKKFVDDMGEAVSQAEDSGVKIGIENHMSSVLNTPEAVRYFGEFSQSPNLGLAMAPYHLPQDPHEIARLIEDLGDKLVFFQAWEHGKGCMEVLPKEEEMQQMPGLGPLDFVPIVGALKKINYAGWTEIFMHPTPRGIPVRETISEVTAEINRSRSYLDQCVSELPA